MLKKKLLLLLALSLSLTGCYRMPTEDDYCVIPTTNNRMITGEKPESPVPGMGY